MQCLAQHRQEEVCVWKSFSRVRLFTTVWSVVRQAPLCPWNSPGKNTGVSSLSLLQGIFLTQESNQGLPHCRWILYQLSYQGSPRILEWVAYLFSSRSSQPRNQTGVSCIAGRFFTSWATRESPGSRKWWIKPRALAAHRFDSNPSFTTK